MGGHSGMDESLPRHRTVIPDTRPLFSQWSLVRAVLVCALLSLSIPLIGACAASKALERTPGIDLSVIKVGATRQQVEAVVGEPQREWTTRTGVRYCLYRYDAGIEPSAGGAGFVVLMDIISLGLYEAIYAVSPEKIDVREERKWLLLAVSYDSQGTVMGVFRNIGQFDNLPEDGRVP